MEHSNTHQPNERQALRRTLTAMAAALGLGIAFDFLLFGKLPGLAFPIYVAISAAALLLWARWQRREVPRTALLVLPLLLFFSSMVFVRASELLTLINIALSFYLFGLFVTLVFRPNIAAYNFRNYFWLPLELLMQVTAKCRELLWPLWARQTFLTKRVSPQVLRGVLIAAPVLLVFVLLFSSADLVFRQYVDSVFNFEINGELVVRALWIAAVTAVFVGLFGLLSFGPAPKLKGAETKPQQRRSGLVETSILLGSLNVLFVSFIAIQITYLFGGAANVIGDGFTYAEYARKGFFELVAVAGLSFVLIFASERFMLRAHGKHLTQFKVLSGLLIAQVLVIMLSAFKRLQLYQEAYGFTSLRLVSFLFIIWLAVVFCGLLYKILTSQREQLFVFALFASVMALLITVNTLNVDGFVVRKNIERYHKTGVLDAEYLSYLSDDSIVEQARLLDTSDKQLRQYMAFSLSREREQLLQDQGPWQSANATRSAALRELNKHAQLLEQNKHAEIQPGYRGPGQD